MTNNDKKEICTIYLLTNSVNGKIYVGQTWEQPFQDRMGRDGKKYANSPYLYASIQKHGVEVFKYFSLIECLDQISADMMEDYYIETMNSRNPEIGYNIKRGGSHGKHSEESRQKIANTLKAQFDAMTPEEKSIRAASISGYWEGKERGPHTDEWKKNNSEITKKRHAEKGHPMQGKHHTEEAKQKISEANTGRKHSEDSVKKRSEKRKMSAEKEQGIIDSYQSGQSIENIILKYETSRGSIYRVLDRNNIPRIGK